MHTHPAAAAPSSPQDRECTCVFPCVSFPSRQLLVTRAVTGLAIGGGIPLVYSIMSDLLGASRRTEGAGAISITVTFGHVIGQVCIFLFFFRLPLFSTFPPGAFIGVAESACTVGVLEGGIGQAVSPGPVSLARVYSLLAFRCLPVVLGDGHSQVGHRRNVADGLRLI